MTDFDAYKVGDEVYCLAWIGKKFDIVAKDDARGIISLQGELENVPRGAQVDVFRTTTYLLSHEKWDQIWYWPDRTGETYQQVFERFVGSVKMGDVVTGYQVEGANPLEPFGCTPERAMAFRILMIHDLGVMIQPVVGVAGNGVAPKREADGDAATEWAPAGPMTSALLKMTDYRWSICYGDVVLNWKDFV